MGPDEGKNAVQIDAPGADASRDPEPSSTVAPAHSALSDEALAQRAVAGDRDAMDRLLRNNFDRIHGICRRITCHPEDAKDATQEAMIAIHRHVATFDGRRL